MPGAKSPWCRLRKPRRLLPSLWCLRRLTAISTTISTTSKAMKPTLRTQITKVIKITKDTKLTQGHPPMRTPNVQVRATAA